MIKTLSMLVLVCLILGCSSLAPKPAEPPAAALYTAYNIWKHDDVVFCINFKSGDEIIPAGTRVRDVAIVKIPYDVRKPQGDHYKRLEFTVADTNEQIRVRFVSRWHPGQTLESYRDMMFTTKNFAELTDGLSAEEIEAIRKGVVEKGMSKRAVLITYGPPPEHATASLDKDIWAYWMNKLKKKNICFDDAGRAIACRERDVL
jgi:hypothetical protein